MRPFFRCFVFLGGLELGLQLRVVWDMDAPAMPLTAVTLELGVLVVHVALGIHRP